MKNKSAVKKRAIIFGCGQAGSMVSKWLSPDCELIGFTDNNQEKWNRTFCDKKIYSPTDAAQQEPDLICLAVLNTEACLSIEKQLKKIGYAGEILSIKSLREVVNLRLATLRLLAEEIRRRQIPGDIAELGVYQGRFAAEMNRLLPEKRCFLFDTFEGFTKEDVEKDMTVSGSCAEIGHFSDTSVEQVLSCLPNPDKAVICPGHFPESIQSLKVALPKFCLVSLDPDLYEPAYQGLKVFYPLLNKGGMILIHDYNSGQFPGVGAAVRRFCEEEKVYVMPLCDLHGSAVLMK